MKTLYAWIVPLWMAVCPLFAQDFYRTDQIQTIEIWFETDNWDQLLDDYYAEGQGARLMAQVIINGEVFDSVGVRYKGHGSYDPNQLKNPFNIKLDYVKNQGYEGYETIKLSNGAKDPSWVREVLSYEIARWYMVAPRANYARVYVNGAYHGVYVNVETVDKPFVARAFWADKSNTFFDCRPVAAQAPPPFGCMEGHGASLEYLGVSPACYANYYELLSDSGWNDLLMLIQALHQQPDQLESVLDLDAAMWMLALHNVLANLDSYLGPPRQNYYLFMDEYGRFRPLPWDLDEAFGRFPTIDEGTSPTLDDYVELDPFLRQGDTTYPLLQSILAHPRWRRMYVAHMRTILNDFFANTAYLSRAQQLQALISNAVAADPNAFFSLAQMQDNLTQTISWGAAAEARAPGLSELMGARTAFLLSHEALAAAPPTFVDWQVNPPLPEAFEEVTFRLTVDGADSVWLQWRHQPDEPFMRVAMYDDGQHDDGQADDGVWAASVQAQMGQLQFYFYAEHTMAGAFFPERAASEWWSVGLGGPVVINELMASNGQTAADAQGEYDDWVELYNRTSEVIDLSDWYLTDDRQQPYKWTFPQGSFIEADGYLIVWADDDEEQPGLHTSFKLDADGESLWLVSPSGMFMDGVVFGPQQRDRSWGRYPNGYGAFAQIDPTFSATNSLPVPMLEAPEVQHLRVWPNPAAEFFFVDGPSSSSACYLYDMKGRRVWEGVCTFPARIEVLDLPKGVYVLQVVGWGTVRVVVSA